MISNSSLQHFFFPLYYFKTWNALVIVNALCRAIMELYFIKLLFLSCKTNVKRNKIIKVKCRILTTSQGVLGKLINWQIIILESLEQIRNKMGKNGNKHL
ncbi:hypothetical protein RFI_08383 [Reticulomyxa filosa]|uniref:Uncharacterized protein n=1 Tax=Reticulomyxa filosa TaxID=46433 RepID=X6NTX3_RETFI|nr:hypothetical protein RFI_08383 [Reticulomyxa filosa]|eukprot:ETO28742.1 hypothetical protein RFI_08383 [Reticulomyxa filosa]